MTTGLKLATLLTAAASGWLALPANAQSNDSPKLLHAHPDRDLPADAGPFWIAAPQAFTSDDRIQESWRIGPERVEALTWVAGRSDRVAKDEAEPDCWVSPRVAAGRRILISMPFRTVFLPGDFTGWVAASEAVVLGTVADLVPGFDATGRANTLVVIEDVAHLYPSGAYPPLVKYVILPYARFTAGGLVFCRPWSESQEYYPGIGDRILVAADAPADPEGLAMTVQALSRVVQVRDDGSLVTYGRSDFYEVDFTPDFPATLDEAKTRARRVWRSGLVDFAASLGLEEFTQLWNRVEEERAELKRRGCDVDQGQFHGRRNRLTFSAPCPDTEDEIVNP